MNDQTSTTWWPRAPSTRPARRSSGSARGPGAEGAATGKPLGLYRHQVEAVRTAHTGANYVLTTGTGSGKSLAYIIPIVDHVLRAGSGKGIKAIVSRPTGRPFPGGSI